MLYVSIIFILIITFLMEEHLKQTAVMNIFILYPIFLFIALFLSLNHFVHGDSVNYQYFYQLNNISFSDMLKLDYVHDKGYIILTFFCSKFINFNTFLFISIFLSLIMIFNFIKKYSSNISLSILIMLPACFFLFGEPVLRQIIAFALCLYAFKYVISRSFCKYFVMIVIATSIHKSALILLGAYFIYNKNISFKMYLTIIMSLGVFFIFAEQISYTLMNSHMLTHYFPRIISYFHSKDITTGYIHKGYLVRGLFDIPLKELIKHILILSFFSIFIFYFPRQKSKFQVLAVMWLGCYFLAIFIPIFMRIAIYFSIFFATDVSHIKMKAICNIKMYKTVLLSLIIILSILRFHANITDKVTTSILTLDIHDVMSRREGI